MVNHVYLGFIIFMLGFTYLGFVILIPSTMVEHGVMSRCDKYYVIIEIKNGQRWSSMFV